MANLKLHPREALPNATAVARAEALYVELVGDPRASLGEMLAHFRAVLESQRVADIQAARDALIGLTQTLKSRR